MSRFRIQLEKLEGVRENAYTENARTKDPTECEVFLCGCLC